MKTLYKIVSMLNQPYTFGKNAIVVEKEVTITMQECNALLQQLA